MLTYHKIISLSIALLFVASTNSSNVVNLYGICNANEAKVFNDLLPHYYHYRALVESETKANLTFYSANESTIRSVVLDYGDFYENISFAYGIFEGSITLNESAKHPEMKEIGLLSG